MWSQGSGTHSAHLFLPGISDPVGVNVCGCQELAIVPSRGVLLQRVGAPAPKGHALSWKHHAPGWVQGQQGYVCSREGPGRREEEDRAEISATACMVGSPQP